MQYALNDVTPNREAIRLEAEQILQDRFTALHLVVEDVSLTNVHFSDDVERGIEATASAHQAVLQASQTLQQARLTAEATLVQANATAQSIKMQADAVNEATNSTTGSNGYVEYTKWSRWNGQLPYSEGGGAVVGPFPTPMAPAQPTALNIVVPPAAAASSQQVMTTSPASKAASEAAARVPGFDSGSVLVALLGAGAIVAYTRFRGK